MAIIGDTLAMGWLQAILLGLLQGLTEFLPVSSTAHMAVVPQLFHQPDPGSAFSAIVQLGPIFAIIFYFRSDLVKYVQGILRTKSPAKVPPDDVDARLGWYTLLGSLPILVAGFLLEHWIDREFRSLDVIGVTMIGLAIVLLLSEVYGKRKVKLDGMTLAQSQGIGWAQVLGLVPGASRSGSTIAAGLFLGLNRSSAARFSFLLSIPAITAAGLYKLYKVVKHSHLGGAVGPYLLAMVVAGVFAYVVIKWFLGYMKEHNTGIFILYRVIFGIAILSLVHTGVLKNELPKDELAAKMPNVAASMRGTTSPSRPAAAPGSPFSRVVSARSPRASRQADEFVSAGHGAVGRIAKEFIPSRAVGRAHANGRATDFTPSLTPGRIAVEFIPSQAIFPIEGPRL